MIFTYPDVYHFYSMEQFVVNTDVSPVSPIYTSKRMEIFPMEHNSCLVKGVYSPDQKIADHGIKSHKVQDFFPLVMHARFTHKLSFGYIINWSTNVSE